MICNKANWMLTYEVASRAHPQVSYVSVLAEHPRHHQFSKHSRWLLFTLKSGNFCFRPDREGKIAIAHFICEKQFLTWTEKETTAGSKQAFPSTGQTLRKGLPAILKRKKETPQDL